MHSLRRHNAENKRIVVATMGGDDARRAASGVPTTMLKKINREIGTNHAKIAVRYSRPR